MPPPLPSPWALAIGIALTSAGCTLVPTTAPQTITHITVHHQGAVWPADGDVPAYLLRLQQWSRSNKGWSDLPYHHIIGPDGTVYAGRSPALPGDSNTDYDTRGHLQVMLMGNFEVQAPTPRQWDATVQLLAQLLKAHGLEAGRIGAHRDHTAQTVCPGAQLMVRFDELRAAAAKARGP